MHADSSHLEHCELDKLLVGAYARMKEHMAGSTQAKLIHTWGPSLVTAALTLTVMILGGWFTFGQRLTAVETGLSGLRELVATRFSESDKRIDSVAADIHADVREIRQILMDGRPPSPPSGPNESGAGKRRN